MRKVSMYSMLRVIVISILFTGCAAHITPEGTYIEPLPAAVIVGPPVVVAPPPHVVVRPLPPVIYYPDRPSLYHYNNVYYYNYHGDWYYGEHERGPWHKLPRKYYPPRKKRYRR